MEFFITGTDTDCGKTLVTLALMERLKGLGGRVAGMKPVAAGARPTPQGLRNADAEAILAHGSHPFPYELINPCCFQTPAAPHLLPKLEGRPMALDAVWRAAESLRKTCDHLVVEGAGGWRVPLTDDLDMAGLCRHLQMPAILVVGLKLGCLNHALLSAEAIAATGVPLAGWIATSLAPQMELEAENLQTLQERIQAPFLGHLPWQNRPDPVKLAGRLRLP